MGKLFVFSIEDPKDPKMVFYLTSKTNEFGENDNAIDLDDPNNKFFSIEDNCAKEINIDCLNKEKIDWTKILAQRIFNDEHVFVIKKGGDLYKGNSEYNDRKLIISLTKMTEDSLENKNIEKMKEEEQQRRKEREERENQEKEEAEIQVQAAAAELAKKEEEEQIAKQVAAAAAAELIKKQKEEEAARKKLEEEEAARKKLEEEEAARKKLEEEEAACLLYTSPSPRD